MTLGWRDCTLGEVINLKRGYDLPQSKRTIGPYPIVSSSGITDFHSEYAKEGPGVVTGRYGTIGEVFYIKGRYWPLNTALYVSDFKGNCPKFTSYLLRTLPLASQNAAGAVPGVNRNHLHKLKVRIPDLPTQHRITYILSSYDDLIELNQRRIEILEEVVQRLFDEWFVHFRYWGHKGEPLVDTELGSIPRGWSVRPLGQLCAKVTDGSHWSPTSQQSSKLMASVKDMGEWGFNLERCRSISEEDFDHLVRNDCRPMLGDILVAKDGANLNKHTFLITEQRDDLVVLSSIAILRPNDQVEREYLTAALKSQGVSTRIKQSVSGAAIPRIILKDFKKLDLIVPPLELQSKWVAGFAPLAEQCRILTKTNRRLRGARDLLLPKLISGEIDVSTAEETFAEAAE